METRVEQSADAKGKKVGKSAVGAESSGAGVNALEFVLLGGLGDVGMRLARMLLEHTKAVVTTVSRRPTGDIDQPESRLRHVSLDLTQGDALETAANSITVNLTEMTQPAFAKQVIDSGGWFLETSATPRYLKAIRATLEGAKGPGTAIMCVGAAPGLTNLMAAKIEATAPLTSQIDIGVEMGMGRHYGTAATEWFLYTSGQPYPVLIDCVLLQVVPGQLKRGFAFREGSQPRHSIGYGFAEQLLIAERSDRRLRTVRSFVALDPAWMTRGLAVLLSLGLGPAISCNARKLAKWLLRLPTVGSTQSRLVVEGFDDAGQLTGQIRVETGDQAEATAAMIFATIQSVLERPEPADAGLTMITDHLHLDAAAANLQRFLPETKLTIRIGDDIANQSGLAK